VAGEGRAPEGNNLLILQINMQDSIIFVKHCRYAVLNMLPSYLRSHPGTLC
jgi:hypothetical protein